MANISITSTCNRSCEYCFAMETLDELQERAASMSLPQFERALDFVQSSGMHEVRLLGGEPTIHPNFIKMLDMVIARGLNLLVFSGGMIPDQVVEALRRIEPDRLSVLVNVIDPMDGHPSELTKQAKVFKRLGERVILGMNIYGPSIQLDFLLDLINRYNLGKTIRLGIAHPILEGSNSYLHPRHYPEVGKRVAKFGRAALKLGVRISFDCGWVPCMFEEGALDALNIPDGEVGLRCNPILDILPDGNVISCYPLASHESVDLESFDDAASLREHFRTRQNDDRSFMLYKKCTTCDWRARGECTGGCLAGSMRRLRGTDEMISLPVTELSH